MHRGSTRKEYGQLWQGRKLLDVSEGAPHWRADPAVVPPVGERSGVVALANEVAHSLYHGAGTDDLLWSRHDTNHQSDLFSRKTLNDTTGDVY